MSFNIHWLTKVTPVSRFIEYNSWRELRMNSRKTRKNKEIQNTISDKVNKYKVTRTEAYPVDQSTKYMYIRLGNCVIYTSLAYQNTDENTST